jgi:hypothetical protein
MRSNQLYRDLGLHIAALVLLSTILGASLMYGLMRIFS